VRVILRAFCPARLEKSKVSAGLRSERKSDSVPSDGVFCDKRLASIAPLFLFTDFADHVPEPVRAAWSREPKKEQEIPELAMRSATSGLCKRSASTAKTTRARDASSIR